MQELNFALTIKVVKRQPKPMKRSFREDKAVSNIRIRADKLADTVKRELGGYAEDLADQVKRAVQDAADTAVKDLRATSPKDTGKYAKSWTQKKVMETPSEKAVTVYARRYQLTHLLENGHAKRGGGRVAARVHIKPVEEKVSKQLEADIRKQAGE